MIDRLIKRRFFFELSSLYVFLFLSGSFEVYFLLFHLLLFRSDVPSLSLSLFHSDALSFALTLSFSLYYLSVLCILPQSLPMTLFLFVKCSLASSVFHLIILYQNPYIKVRCIFEYRFKFSTQFPKTNYCSQKDGCF